MGFVYVASWEPKFFCENWSESGELQPMTVNVGVHKGYVIVGYFCLD